ncbi:hypothetical protein KKA47_01995, partial [bacterium]|nr:hypothetical protein [bacterium]
MKLTIRPDDPKGRDASLESYGEDILNDTGSLPRRQAGFTNAQDDKLFGKQTITFYNPILLAGPESAATPPRKPLTIDQIFTNIAKRILDKDDPDDPQVVALKRVFIYSLQDIQDGFNPSRRVRGTTPTVREMGGAFDRNYATAASKISLATEDLQRFRDRFMAFVLGRAVELGLVGTATVSQKSKATSLTIYPSTADVAIRLRRAYLLIRGAEENLNRLKSIHVIPAKAGIQQSPKRLDPRWSLPSAKAGGGDDNGVRGDDNGVRGDDNGVRRDDTRYDSMLAQLEKYKAALEKLGSGGDEETYNSDVVRRKLGGNDLLTERALKIAQGIEDISRDSIIMKRVELFDFKDPFIAKFVKDIKPNLKAYVDKYISGKGSDPGGDYDFYFRVAEVFAAYWVHENRSNVPSHITSSVDARDMAVYHVVSHMGMAPKEAKELVLKAHNFIYSLIRQDSWSSRTADIAGFPSTEKIRGITALPVVASQTYPVGRFVQYDLTGMRDYVDNMGLLIDDDFHDRFYTEVGVKFNTFLGWGGLTTPSISRFSWKILVDKILSPDELKVFIQNNPPAENEIRKVIGNFETEGGGDVNGTWKRYVDGVANTGWLKSFALNKYPRPDKMPRDLWLRYVEYARSIGRLEYVSVEPVSTRSLEAVTKAFDFLAVELEKYNKFIDPLEYIAAISPVMRRVVAKSRESFGVAYIEKLGIVDDVDFANLSFKAFADALKKGGHADRIAHLETIIDFHAHGGSRMPLNANLEEYANSLSDLCMGDRQKIENLYTFLAGFLKWVFFIEGYVEVYNISGQNVSFASNRFREHSTVQLRADPADYKSGQVTGVTNEEQMIIINIYRDVYSRLLEKVRGYLDAVDSVANLLSAKVDFSAVSENGFNRDGFETTYGEMLDKNRIYQEGLQQR